MIIGQIAIEESIVNGFFNGFRKWWNKKGVFYSFDLYRNDEMVLETKFELCLDLKDIPKNQVLLNKKSFKQICDSKQISWP